MRDIFLYSITLTIRSNSLENKFTVGTKWFREEHARRFVARPFILFRIQDAPDISGKIHFGFQSLQTISGASRRAESCRRKSYVVDLTDGANRLQPPLTRRTSKPPWLYERRRIPVRKKRNVSERLPDGRGKNETRNETVGSTNKRGRQWRRSAERDASYRK